MAGWWRSVTCWPPAFLKHPLITAQRLLGGLGPGKIPEDPIPQPASGLRIPGSQDSFAHGGRKHWVTDEAVKAEVLLDRGVNGDDAVGAMDGGFKGSEPRALAEGRQGVDLCAAIELGHELVGDSIYKEGVAPAFGQLVAVPPVRGVSAAAADEDQGNLRVLHQGLDEPGLAFDGVEVGRHQHEFFRQTRRTLTGAVCWQ